MTDCLRNPMPSLVTRMHRFASGVLLATCTLLSANQDVFAQASTIQATSTDQVKFPAGLKWEQMREVEVNDMPGPGDVGAKKPDVAVSHSIWMDEIKRSFKEAPGFRVSILLGQAASKDGTLLTFSLINMMDFERCEPPLNGKDVVDMYSKCLARVHVNRKPQAVVKEFVGFCNLHITNSKDNPLSKNHTQFAFDARTNTAYFRVMQFGKIVPACYRAIALEGL